MFGGLRNVWHLLRAGRTFAAYDFFLQPDQMRLLPWYARFGIRCAGLGARVPETDPTNQVSVALASLGPSYIKLGQFLATRPDMIGARRAFALKSLQDRLPPFDMGTARKIIENSFGVEVEALFREFGPPIAAASIAQVHRAITLDGREVAVKILRPGVEKRFSDDLKSFYFAGKLMELSQEGRRLRPVAAVQMLEHSMRMEIDLRLEASALSEVGENSRNDPGFRVPTVDWRRTAKHVLTTSWVAGTPLADVERLKAQGFDLKNLGDTLIRTFLYHAIRDGFFHADMHQGNLFVDEAGLLVAVDFGITGRLSEKDRLFLAEILYGFITRDYMRVARVHFDAGYVPSDQSVDDFAQAIRSIGEPIFGLSAQEISMARLLTQLFEITSQFHMRTQPQLLMLQKTMVVVEGVARSLNPDLNMWVSAEPVVRQWLERKLGPIGKIEEGWQAVVAFIHMMAVLPEVVSDMKQQGGLKLGVDTVEKLGKAGLAGWLIRTLSLVVGAAALTVIAVKLVMN